MPQKLPKALLFLSFSLTLAGCTQNAPPLNATAGASPSVAVSAQAVANANLFVDWGDAQATITNELYGTGIYGGVAPSISSQTSYKKNMGYFKPGLLRFHYGGLINNSATDIRGWVDEANRRWDAARINTVMSTFDSFKTTDYGNGTWSASYMMNVPTWPSWMKTYDYTYGGQTVKLLDPSEFDNYAAFCASLATILKNQGRQVKYFVPMNEWDAQYYVPFQNGGDKISELVTIYNKAAIAVKQVYPGILVGGPDWARGDLNDQVNRFIQGAKANLDFVAYHFYANDDPYGANGPMYDRSRSAARHGQDIANIARQQGLNVPIFNTEFNINYAGNQDYRQSLSAGAVYDTLIFTAGIETGTTATATWNDRDGYYGKLNNNDETAANPDGNSLRMGAQNMRVLNNYLTGTKVNATSDNANVVVLATRTSGRKSVALINRSGSAQTVKLSFFNWSTTSSFDALISAPDPKYFYTKTVSFAGATDGTLSLDPDSVTVLTVANSQNVTSSATELSRTGWTPSASSSYSAEPPAFAIDASTSNRWSTGGRQQPGMWFQLDLGSSKTFDKIVLKAGGPYPLTDYPRRYSVYATNDLANLGNPLVTGAGWGPEASGTTDLGTGGGKAGLDTIITFAPQTARYVRIVLRSAAYFSFENWWGISDMRLYRH